MEVLKLFIDRDWKGFNKERFRSPRSVHGHWGRKITDKVYDGTMESFLDISDSDDDRRWYDVVRSSFIDLGYAQIYISILDESCWYWDGIVRDIWPRVASCERFQEFDQDWRELAKKQKSDHPEVVVLGTVKLAQKMAQVLHFYRKYNAYHSNAYYGGMWR